MNKTTSIAVLATGLILLVFGLSASDSIGSGFSRLFTGAPTDRAVWLLIGGTVATVVGLGGLLRGSRS